MSEYDIQASFVEWCQWNEAKYPSLRLAFSTVNGAHLAGDDRMRAIKMARLKKSGLRPGVPDWCLPYAINGYTSLWIEFKSPKGKLSPAQKDYIGMLEANGHAVCVCTDWQEATKIVLKYLKRSVEC